MPSAITPTSFVTGISGSLGAELVRVLLAAGHDVTALADSIEQAQPLRDSGARVVVGSLLSGGQWQDEVVACDWIFHTASTVSTARIRTWADARSIAAAQLAIDRHLLDVAATGGTRRIVYVAHTSCYGHTSGGRITEDAPMNPTRWGRSLMPALDRLDGYLAAGLPIVTAFPGFVFGSDDWHGGGMVRRILEGRRILQFGQRGPWVSPIHARDGARALTHLAGRGEIGGRYFVVNADPVRLNDLAEIVARLAGRPLRTWRLPAGVAKWIVGPVLAERALLDATFSNIRLRGTGFRYDFPTIEDGLRQLLGAQHD